MLSIPPPKVRLQRRRVHAPKVTAPAGLTLKSASYDSVLMLVLLSFDRPVNTTGVNVASITVNDPVTHGHLYVASGSPVALPPNGIQIMLAVSGASSGSGVTLSIASGNGITGTDGTPFAGISGVGLPYSEYRVRGQ